MAEIQISLQQARQFMLAHQGLWPPYSLQGEDGIMEHIRRVGCIQFDPLNIAGFNHDLVLQSRVDNYRPELSQQLLYQQRRLVDGWDKCMSIYPVEDWPFFRRYRRYIEQRLGKRKPPPEVLDHVRAQLEQQGPLSSLDIGLDDKVNWAWGPTRQARAALESMYAWGELVVHSRVHTRRIYDLARRHIPQEIFTAPDPNPTDEQYQDWYVLRRIGSVGLLWGQAGDAWLGMTGVKGLERRQALARLEERGEILPVKVEGLKQRFFVRAGDAQRMPVRSRLPVAVAAAVLAPLDNLLWDRKLIAAVFGFTYTWEVYKPAAERQYGYYVLPVLHRDRFVARFEPVRDKKTGALVIKNWWWEPGVKLTASLQAGLQQGIKRFAQFLGATEITSESVEKLEWLPEV